MSLRARLSILITLLFLLMLVGGSMFIINNARRAIHDEVQSAARFTLQLIEIALTSIDDAGQPEVEEALLSRVSQLESSRHLQIRILRRSSLDDAMPVAPDVQIKADAPDWFVTLVKPQFIEHRRLINTGDRWITEIQIRADPSDEISEVWQDSRDIFAMFILFVVLSVLIVYYTLGRGLAPIAVIQTGLEGIEHGDYRLRLPRFNLPELSQISERFNLMAAVLDRTRQENRELTRKSLAIQELERQHPAHELHDELGQSIAAIRAVASSIGQCEADTEALKDRVNTINEVSNHMYDVARGMMHRLRPAVLDEFGLVRALQDMIDDWNSVHEDVFCEFKFTGDFDLLDENTRISIYRIVQESLTNVIKHSQANKVLIEMCRIDGRVAGGEEYPCELQVKIEDNGVGFDETGIKRGLGFLGMQERVEALAGRIRISTEHGKGVKIKIDIPLASEATGTQHEFG